MRAKNEFKFLAEAYNTKLLFERIVDGTLMCPEACCGAPVMECKCGPDCEHCNCHEIQKLAKEEDNEVHLQGTGFAAKPPPVDEEGIDDSLPGSLGPKVTPTHKPYVTSYTSNDNKKVFDVLDSNGQPVFRTHNKREAYKWFKANYENI